MGNWGALVGKETQLGYFGLALVVGTGLSTSLVALSHASQTEFGPGEGLYIFTPVVVSIALVVTGVLLWINKFNGWEMFRIGISVFLGMAVFGLLVTWTITHELLRGDSFAYAPFVTANSMSVGGFVGLVLGWFDARNRRNENRVARERNRFKRQTEELDEFAGIVSHDLRNPLNVATLELQTAKEYSESEQTKDALSEVEESLDRMERIIEDVLAMAREGQVIEEEESLSLAAVAQYSWNHVETNDATLQLVDSGHLLAEKGALEHIFENLFRNAVKHSSTSPGSHTRQDAVELCSTSPQSQAPEDREAQSASSSRTQSDDAVEQSVAETQTESDSRRSHEKAVELPSQRQATEEGGGMKSLTVRVGVMEDGFYVEDNGTGIPPETRSRLFEPGVTTNDNGTGLGLSIVEKLVSAHGWEIRATNSDEGGARFEITGVEYVSTPAADSWLTTPK